MLEHMTENRKEYLRCGVPDAELDRVTYNMLLNNEIAGLIAMDFADGPEGDELRYDITGLSPFEALLKDGKLSTSGTLSILKAFSDVVLRIADYLIPEERIVFDLAHVYVDRSTWELKLICLPVKQEATTGFRSFCLDFLLRDCFAGGPYDPSLDALYSVAADEQFSIKALRKALDCLERGEAIPVTKTREEARRRIRVEQEAAERAQSEANTEAAPELERDDSSDDEKQGTPPNDDSMSTTRETGADKQTENQAPKRLQREASSPAQPGKTSGPTPPVLPVIKYADHPKMLKREDKHEPLRRLIRQDNNDFTPQSVNLTVRKDAALIRMVDRFRIPITKHKFQIGTKQSLADYCIFGNPTVSRVQASILYINDSFYLADDGSHNGTFLNGERLFPGQPMVLKNGDVIRFSTDEYVFSLTENDTANK